MPTPQFVEQQRQNDRAGEAGNDVRQSHADGVEERRGEPLVLEHHREVIIPRIRPRTAQNALADLVVLEGDHQAVHRAVAEQQDERNARQQEKIHPAVFPDPLAQGLPTP